MPPPLTVYRSRLRPDWTEGSLVDYQGQPYIKLTITKLGQP